MPMKPIPVKGAELYDGLVYSSVILGDGAVGSTKLFTVPQGQPIPRIPAAAKLNGFLEYSEITTNLVKAGAIGGGSLGDGRITKLSVDFIGEHYKDFEHARSKTHFSLRVADQPAFSCVLSNLPLDLVTPLRIAYADTIEGRIDIPTPLILITPIVLRITLRGLFERPQRC